MTNQIIVREARPEDYSNFLRMEKTIWKGTTVKPISEEMFLTWINTFSDGFRLALVDGKVCGHIYSQICDFDPFDESDDRNLYEMRVFERG